jgi:hypothetical protein
MAKRKKPEDWKLKKLTLWAAILKELSPLFGVILLVVGWLLK